MTSERHLKGDGAGPNHHSQKTYNWIWLSREVTKIREDIWEALSRGALVVARLLIVLHLSLDVLCDGEVWRRVVHVLFDKFLIVGHINYTKA